MTNYKIVNICSNSEVIKRRAITIFFLTELCAFNKYYNKIMKAMRKSFFFALLKVKNAPESIWDQLKMVYVWWEVEHNESKREKNAQIAKVRYLSGPEIIIANRNWILRAIYLYFQLESGQIGERQRVKRVAERRRMESNQQLGSGTNYFRHRLAAT